jgi:hypothetical protein
MSKGNDFKKVNSKSSAHFQIKEDPTPKTNYELSKPIFSFHYMQYGGINCISRCQREIKSSIVDMIVKLSQSTWREMSSKPKDGLGHEKIPQWRFKISLQLPSRITQEVPVIVFRYSESGRIAGFREKDIFHIIAVGNNLYKH